MAEDNKIAPADQEKEESRSAAILAYYEAETKDERAEVVRKFPFLTEIFSAGNHS